MAERLDIVSQSNFPTNKSNTVEIVTTTKKKVTTASASDIATLVTPAISNLDIATQTNFPIQESDAQSDFIITTDGGVNNVTAEAAAALVASYIPTGGGGDPHEPDFTEDYSTNYSDFSNFTGSGTEADPYQIWNEKMFLNARFKVNNGGLSSATYFKQMRDIVWQFDGIGWGFYTGTINIYDVENTEVVKTGSYGSSTAYQYINFDGAGWTLYINNKETNIYNETFIKNLLNYNASSGKVIVESDIELYIFYGSTFKNLNLKFTGTTITGSITSPSSASFKLTILRNNENNYNYIISNCKIEGLTIRRPNNKFVSNRIIDTKCRMENCFLKDISYNYSMNLIYSTCSSAYGVYNTIIENIKMSVSGSTTFILVNANSVDTITIKNCILTGGTILIYTTGYLYNSNIENISCSTSRGFMGISTTSDVQNCTFRNIYVSLNNGTSNNICLLNSARNEPTNTYLNVVTEGVFTLAKSDQSFTGTFDYVIGLTDAGTNSMINAGIKAITDY